MNSVHIVTVRGHRPLLGYLVGLDVVLALACSNALFVLLTGSESRATLLFETDLVLTLGAVSIALGRGIAWFTATLAITVNEAGVELENRFSPRVIPWEWFLGRVTKAPFGGVGIWYHDPRSPIASSRQAFLVTDSQARAILAHPNCRSEISRQIAARLLS
jgi:lysylphosphatidylglycerol synthetase-like protein (DUF2156 family)